MNIKELIRKNFIAIAAIAIVAGSSAFMAAEKSQKSNDAVWFVFDSELNPGDEGYEDDVLDPTKYTNTGDPTSPGCSGVDKVCAVQAEPDINGNIPQQTLDNLESELMNPSSTHPDIERKPND